MSTLYVSFSEALKQLDKETCIQLTIGALDKPDFSLIAFYEDVLAHALHTIENDDVAVWKEHVQSSIVRTCLELCAPYVLKSKKTLSPPKNAIVFCQEEEYHELGARMTTDFLNLLGFDTLFIGANTPKTQALLAIQTLHPELICISVTNFYHLSKTPPLIQSIRTVTDAKIIIGGYAVFHSSHVEDQIAADFYAKDYQDLKTIKEALYASVF